MYSDKDFQKRELHNRSGTCSQKEQSTGMTLNASGRGAADEYQLNDSDLPAIVNHTIALSYSKNPLFSNDSSWNDNSLPKIAPLLLPAPSVLVRQQPVLAQVQNRPKSIHRIDLMGSGPTTESIEVGPEPSGRQSLLRR